MEERRKRWGETSPLYVAKVLAEFPDSDENALISPTLIRAAQDRELPPGVDPGRYGCDIARSGRDETMIYRHHDGTVRLEHRSHGADLMQTTGEIARLLRANPKVSAIVDVIGLGRVGAGVAPGGAGVFDRLREKFANRRAAAWWATREAFIDGELDLDPDDDELAARILIEAKDQMRKRGLPSPWRRGPLTKELRTDRSESPGCEFCGASLDGMRSHARFCGASCRREHYRISALLSGRPDSGYPTLGAYLRKRAKRRAGA